MIYKICSCGAIRILSQVEVSPVLGAGSRQVSHCNGCGISIIEESSQQEIKHIKADIARKEHTAKADENAE